MVNFWIERSKIEQDKERSFTSVSLLFIYFRNELFHSLILTYNDMFHALTIDNKIINVESKFMNFHWITARYQGH